MCDEADNPADFMECSQIEEAVREDLSGKDFSNRSDLVALDAEGGRMDRCNFSGSTLRDSRFEECSLKEANFQEANLSCSDFDFADCTGANFRNANFASSSMDGTLMTEAIMINTCLQNASIDTANFKGTVGIYDAGTDSRDYRFVGVWCDGTYKVFGISEGYKGWAIKAGCRWYTKNEALLHWGPDCENNPEAMELVNDILGQPEPVLPQKAA